RTRVRRPFLVRNALTAASAAARLSGCTGRAASSGDSKVMEQPPMMHGRRHSAIAGVPTIPTRAAAKTLRLNTPFPPLPVVLPRIGPATRLPEGVTIRLRVGSKNAAQMADRFG